jgi:aspartyl-tRNA(Asn)/glutamyl-tRNA(Gln) amidotransferase subunit A
MHKVTAGGSPVLKGKAEMKKGESMTATEHYLEVIERLNPKINAVLTVTADMAIEMAQAADKASADGEWMGILHGVPMLVKDCLNVTGVRTTFGSGMYRDNIASSDSEVVRRIRRSGPVFLGKTNLPEFCYGATTQNVHYGDCLNPWDTTRVSGGSSGGAAAAAAAGMCRIAFGSDTGGSVRGPASLCGVVGIRPTTGRVPNTNALALTIHADTIGMLARTVPDVARGFAAIAGYDPDDSFSEDVPVDNFLPSLFDGIDGIRVGIPKSFFYENCQPDVVARVQEATRVIEACGAILVDIDIEGAEETRVATGPTLLAMDMADLHRDDMRGRPDAYGPEVLRRLRSGEPFKGTDYAHALRILIKWKHQFKRVFQDVDMLLTPSTPMTAPKWADSQDLQKSTHGIMRNLVGLGYAGLPCLNVPVGLDSEGLPVGMQLAGKWFNEPLLFRAGAAYQMRTDFHKMKPPIHGDRPESVPDGKPKRG